MKEVYGVFTASSFDVKWNIQGHIYATKELAEQRFKDLKFAYDSKTDIWHDKSSNYPIGYKVRPFYFNGNVEDIK